MSANLWVLLILGSAGAVYAAHRTAFWLSQGKRVLEPGYAAPEPSLVSRLLRWALGRVFLFLFVGPVKVIGRENLKFYGRLIALGNHQTERDALVTLWMMGLRPLRYFIASNQATGVRAPLVAYTGGIVVHTERPRAAGAALVTAIKAMCRELTASFVIFPQGRLVRDNALRREDFRPGVVLLANRSAKCSEMPLAYLPFAVFYDRNPAHADRVYRIITRWMGWKSFRRFFGEMVYGATIVVGQPVPVQILPEDPQLAVDVLFNRLVELNAQAQGSGCGAGTGSSGSW